MTATMKIYYISGRISGDEHNAKELFRKAKEFLQQLGYGVVNPFDNGLHSDSNWERHLAVDIIDFAPELLDAIENRLLVHRCEPLLPSFAGSATAKAALPD